MKILVIGSNSFSGSNFIKEALVQGFGIIAISRSPEIPPIFRGYDKEKNLKNFEFHKLDLVKNSYEIAKIASINSVEIIVNFAAQSMVAESWERPEDWYATNCVGLSSLVKFLMELKVPLKKFIQFTTPEVYGSTQGWITENFNFNPTTPYAISRAAGDMHLKAMQEIQNFPVIFTRTANVYGETQLLYRIVPKTIMHVLNNKKINLHGGGLSERSFIHVTDVSDALIRLLKNGEVGSTYHISTKSKTTIKDLVEMILSRMDCQDRNLLEIAEERPGKDQFYLLDSTKIRKELQWEDKVSLMEGIDRVVEWATINQKKLSQVSTSYQHRS
jgi:dTDP-glucose 4,6-dehydratase